MKRDWLFIKVKNLFSSLRTQKAALFSGLLIGTSYMPFPPWALLICLIPLWSEVLQKQESFWKSFWRGWWTQFVLTLIGFYWIAYVSHEFGYIPWPISILVLLLFAATVHIYFALAVGAAQVLRNKLKLNDVATVCLMAGFTALGEMWWPSLFPWNFGYPFLWIHSPVAQVADVIGFEGLSVLVLFANAGLTLAIFRAKNRRQVRPVILQASVIIAVIVGLYGWGQMKKKEWQTDTRPLKILQVQANIGNFEKYMAAKGNGFEQMIVDQYFNLTRDALKNHDDVDLVIWPESAYPDFLNAPELKTRFYAHQFAQFVDEIKKPILTGALSHAFDARGFLKVYNAFFLYGPPALGGGELEIFGSPYHKVNLLMFGEYTPLSETFPWLAQVSPAGTGFARGPGPQVILFKDYNIGAQICYEGLSPSFSGELATLGADLMVNLTNDSWFGPTSEPRQHMIMTLARGIETRRPLLRTTNTGITTAILADGTQLAQSPVYEPWAQVFEIPVKKNAPTTFFSKYGTWLPWLLLIFLILIILTGRDRARP